MTKKAKSLDVQKLFRDVCVVADKKQWNIFELVDEYIGESQDGNWEGYSEEEVRGVVEFLKDLVRYAENAR